MKTIVIGLDGATWDLINPWISKGFLPNLRKMLERSVYGDLESTIPFITNPAWLCYSTGKNPAKIGNFNWCNIYMQERKCDISKVTSLNVKQIWDYLGDSGFKCGVINMPLTYPPKNVNGFMISGLHAFNDSNYTYPKELKKKLVEKYDYKVEPESKLNLNVNETIVEIEDLIKMRFRVANELLVEYDLDFLHLTIFFIDTIQHSFWRYMNEGDSPYSGLIRHLWTVIDGEIGDLINNIYELDPQSYIFLMSDHGFTGVKGRFLLNQWLINKGYLHLNSKKNINIIFEFFNKFGLNKEKIENLIRKSIFNKLVTRLPIDFIRHFYHKMPLKSGGLSILSIFDYIDWEKTMCIANNDGLLHLVNKSDWLINNLINKMKCIRDPNNGEYIVDVIKKSEDVYSGDFLDLAPDLIIIPHEGYELKGNIKQNGDLWDYGNNSSGCHKVHGVFLAYGPDINKNVQIFDTKIYDIAPTILHLFGISIPEDVDGKVLEKIFIKKRDRNI